MSRAMAEQGARGRATGVYVGVHEDGELPRNAAMASAVVFKTASKSEVPSRGCAHHMVDLRAYIAMAQDISGEHWYGEDDSGRGR
jgi:hypothetical protein